MSIFDGVILVILALSIVIGFWRGLVREALSLIMWVLAIVLALRFAKDTAIYLPNFIHSNTFRFVTAFLLILISVHLIGLLIVFLVRSLVSKIGLGWADKTLGLVFGAVRGVLAVAVLILFINYTPFANSNWFVSSFLPPYFVAPVAWLNAVVPDHLQSLSDWFNEQQQQQQPTMPREVPVDADLDRG